MLWEARGIGSIMVGRGNIGEFSEKEIALLRTFADQAVIAIQNARLFNETKEALEQQTATAEILRVISSSPTDVQPVFEAIVQSGVRLFENAAVAVVRPDGDQVRLMAIAESDPQRAGLWRGRFPSPLTREYMHGAAILDCTTVDVPDVLALTDRFQAGRQNFLASGYRVMTVAPMVRDGVAIGTISVIRMAPGPLADKQLALLKTFADQAVIAIENVRLFNETKEALERQTATAEILKVISGSPTDVQPVFETIVRNAVSLCGSLFANVFRFDGELVHFVASHHVAPGSVELIRSKYPKRPDSSDVSGRVLLTKSGGPAGGCALRSGLRPPICRGRGLPQDAGGADAAGGQSARRHRGWLGRGRTGPQRPARVLEDIRRSGGDRHRERAAAAGAAGAEPRPRRSPRAADCDRGDPPGDQQLTRGRAAGVRRRCAKCGELCAAVCTRTYFGLTGSCCTGSLPTAALKD